MCILATFEVGRLMVAYYRAGRRAEAIDAFDHLRKRLSADLGVLPGSDVSDVRRRLLEHVAHHAALCLRFACVEIACVIR